MSTFSYPPPEHIPGVEEPTDAHAAWATKQKLREDVKRQKRKLQRTRTYNVKSGKTREEHDEWVRRATMSYEWTTAHASYINKWLAAYWDHYDASLTEIDPTDDAALVRMAHLIIEECRRQGARVGDFPEALRAGATMIQRRATGLV